MFVDPEDGIEFFVTGVGDVVGVPDGHVHKAGLCAIEFEGHYLVSADAAQLNGGFPFDHGEAFGFAGMEVVAAGDAGHSGAEAYLSAAVELDGFDEAATVVGVEFEVVGEEALMVEVAEEGVPEVAHGRITEIRDFATVVISLLKRFEDFKQSGDCKCSGVLDFHFLKCNFSF